jgi:NAD(P)-dependent dehydrogenase (short-subunit alcohol dehydrogenase family)
VALHCATTGSKIRCNSVHPGQIKTDMHDKLIAETARLTGASEAAVREQFLTRIPSGEYGEPDDVAYAVLYLASDESKHVTGIQMVVDGGMELSG